MADGDLSPAPTLLAGMLDAMFCSASLLASLINSVLVETMPALPELVLLEKLHKRNSKNQNDVLKAENTK